MAKKIKISNEPIARSKKLIKKNNIIICIAILTIVVVVGILFKMKLFRPSLELIKDSVVMIEVYDSNNNLISTGSGFCAYENDYIVTNFHVIEGGYSMKIIDDSKEKYSVDKIVVFNQKDDLAIVKFNGKLNPLKVNTGKNIKVKNKVTAIGSPKGELNTVSEGIVSNVDDNNLIRISVPISHGSSGGVLLDDNYEVVGITNAGYTDAENLNFAISSKLLGELYNNYKNKKYDVITSDNYKECAPNILNFNTQNQLRIEDKCGFSSLYTYSTNSINDFYKATNSYEIFNTKITILSYGFSNNYRKLTKNEQILASEYYTELLKYEDCNTNYYGNCTIDNISSWNKDQMIMELDVMTTMQLAVFKVEIEKYNTNNVFKYIDSLDLNVPNKGILLLLYGGYTPQRLSNNDAKSVIDFINDLNISANDKGKILSYLGYTVNGSNVNW